MATPLPTSQQSSSSSSASANNTKRELTSWWKRFNMKMRRDDDKGPAAANTANTANTPINTTTTEVADAQGQRQSDASLQGRQSPGIFGVPLQDSIKYANVAISLSDGEGNSFVYGYVPIVVAKCGVFLKETATETEGIFRLNGSAKRIKDLQTIFDSPDRYGKGLDWVNFTVHDAANILRRYLNLLPEPIIPLDFYERFRDPLRQYYARMGGYEQAKAQEISDADLAELVRAYQQVITELPPLNRQLLLYILDLLAVFASKADINKMPSTNLAAIFQPGMLFHPSHDMMPEEYDFSQQVLVFLIENQDHFLIGMRGTAADEETVREAQSRVTTTPPPPTTPSSGGVPARSRNNIGRSSSNASAGADSVRRFGGLRRNVSVSSKHSRQSSHAQSPSTPGHNYTMSGSGVHRSNTFPSKKSPGLGSNRFARPSNPSTPTASAAFPPIVAETSPTTDHTSSGLTAGEVPATTEVGPSQPVTDGAPIVSNNVAPAAVADEEHAPLVQTHTTVEERSSRETESIMLDNISPPVAARNTSPSATPAKERNFSSLFSRSPTSDSERKEARPPNKLRKKPKSLTMNGSAHSSTHSLNETS
ncbi:MAG: hypothetical protein M1816_001765 [Peltula sp. TS41687]|nr:MAG: hypothetical protein M1816_001765 [Peltula sp. TS41687]